MKKIQVILGALLILASFQACKKKNVVEGPYMGPAICASETFDYTTPFRVNGSATPASFNFGTVPYYVALTATFNETVAWTITITGVTSGAVKTYTGTSKDVNVKWYGNANGGEANGDIFFKKTGEQVNIKFSPACREDKAVSIPLTVAAGSNFDKFGTVVADFDAFASVYFYNSADPNIGPYVRNKDTALAVPSGQGGNCRKMYAPQGRSGWYIGGFGQSCDLTTVLGANITNPDSVYINLYVRGNNKTVVTLDMVETVGINDYHFKKNIVINWTGWKMVSYKLSELFIGNPAKVKSLDCSVGPNEYNAETEAYIDFMIFTKGKPFLGAN